MTRYWELDLYIYLVLCSFVLVGLLVLRAWWQDRKKWRAVKPYYGKPYDASVTTYRPNVDLRRVR